MANTITSVQVFRPDGDSDVFTRTVYACNLPLALIRGAGAVLTAEFSANELLLGERELIRNVRIFTKEALDGPGLTKCTVDLGNKEGGALQAFQSFGDVSVNTMQDGNLNSSSGSASTASTDNYVTNGTLTTLQDSLAGNCTPDAITALIATARTRVTTVNFNGVPNRVDLEDGTAAFLTVKFTTVGCNLDALTAGDLWVYFETEIMPTYAV